MRGDAAAEYIDSYNEPCPSDLTPVILPADYDGADSDSADEVVVEDDDDEEDEITEDEGSSTVIVDGDDDLQEEDDDTAEVRGGVTQMGLSSIMGGGVIVAAGRGVVV